jgi:Lar family restriction alleviation protein|tara:strand:- start:2148 stop:2393 length:246 start_codon:yes stop_codon:yes gene_type:complete
MIDVNPNDWRKYLPEEDKKVLREAKVRIKPCPFCGHPKPQLLESDTTCWISCINCEADGPVLESVKAAESAWNKRFIKNNG